MNRNGIIEITAEHRQMFKRDLRELGKYLESGKASKEEMLTIVKLFNHLNRLTEEVIMLEEDAEKLEYLREEVAARAELAKKARESVFEVVDFKESDDNYINDSPIIKALVRKEKGEYNLGINKETGEAAIFTLIDGYVTPYEKEILECVSKFNIDGQVTENGKTFFTLGQLYRSLRHGKGTQSPTKEQRAELLVALTELSRPERKLSFVINDYLKVWGGFETNGGRIRIVSFDELYGKYRGQEDILIVLDETPVLCMLSQNLRMGELIDQSIKAIKQPRYTLEFKQETKTGKPITKRSFSSNEQRQEFCKKNGITKKDIVKAECKLQPYSLTENRISIRSVLFSFVFSYIRATTAGKTHSNKLPYKTIWERCGLSNDSNQIKRDKEAIFVILDHLKRERVISSWKEYANKGSRKANGIEIKISKSIAERGGK